MDIWMPELDGLEATRLILTKLDARDRTQLVVIAYESGLVVPGRSYAPGAPSAD